MKQYRVIAACVVHVPISTVSGQALGTLYRDTLFEGDPSSAKIKHLLAGGMIEEIRAGDPEDEEPEDEEPKDPATSQESEAPQEPATQQESGAQTVPPPPEGGPGSGKQAWVEYAVQRGMDRAEAEALDRGELIARLK